MNENNKAVTNVPAVRTDPGIIQGASVDMLLAQSEKVMEVMRKAMKEGVHYGLIPGCGDKPTLLQPGAQKLCLIFGLVPTYQEEVKELGNGHREYRVTCTLHTRGGMLAGQGVGSGSTMESKWRYVRGQENPNIANTHNTVLKMTAKRAFVAAVTTALAASDLFTQDLEEMDIAEAAAKAAPPPGSNVVKSAPTHPTQSPQPVAQSSHRPSTAEDWNQFYAQFTYRYNIPYKESQNAAVKSLLKEKGFKFRGDKNQDKSPNGDANADKNWYGNYYIEAWKEWLNPVPKVAAEVYGDDDIPFGEPVESVDVNI